MDADFGDVLRLAEADVLPRLARVGRFVDAVAGLDVAANARLARADEDDVRIRFRHGDRADRRTRDLAVGHRRPRLAAVRGLPQAAASGAEIAFLRPLQGTGHRQRAAAAVGADAAPLIGGHQRGIDTDTRRGLGSEAVIPDDAGRSREYRPNCKSCEERLRYVTYHAPREDR